MTAILHAPDLFAGHDKPGHAENARRFDRLAPDPSLPRVAPRPARDRELLAVHTPAHLQRIRTVCAGGGGQLDPDTYCVPESEAIARSAAGGLIDMCRAVRSGAHDNGFALVRPPGHHATPERAMGFCLYNFVAVAAAALRRDGVSRLAIVDFDVHHGNGTQEIFYGDGAVLYLSSHQYPHYPGTGAASETGAGDGLGATLNCPLPAGAGDAAFLAAYRERLLPALAAFRPEFILVSAGYDAHRVDPLAGLEVSTAGFTSLARLLMAAAADSCGGRIVFCLEGGYDPVVLGECVTGAIAVLADAKHGDKGSPRE